ncbi:MAG TPA: sugar phosphate isomerase/epimerase [Gemmatimonadaceae bacterium]|nr:sugar phosphate isomerase/epimerase [Gemmatimonadaceae bacterium]
MERRDFIRTALGAVAGGALLPGLAAAEWRGRADRLRAIGLQLYTVRTAMAADVEGTLAAVAAIGYREVEFAGLFGRSPRDVRAMLGRHGLVAPSSHVAVPAAMDEWKRDLDDALVLGQSYIVCPWIDEKDRTTDGLKRVAARFNAAGAAAKQAGLQFAYHNHDFEFTPVDGRLPYDLLLAECDRSLVKMEIDIYWMVNGGQDPLAYLARDPSRFPMVHAKDRTADGKMADVGAGRIDFPKILGAFERAGLTHCFVERDDAPQPMASARASFAYLDRLTF